LFNTTDHDNSRQATDGVLYSLGIVFYEIFSRGEWPAELEQQQQQVGEGLSGSSCQNGTEELSLNFDQGGAIDLEGELSIFDDLLSDYNLSDNDNLLYDDVCPLGSVAT